MNLTLSVDERLVRRARKQAEAMGKSLNQLVREYVERLAGSDDAERDMAELRQLSRPPVATRAGGLSIATSSMSARSFLDTNVLLYTHAGDAPAKRARALDLLGEHAARCSTARTSSPAAPSTACAS